MMDLATSPSFRVDGKAALITGAGRGIGLAAACALADAGARVTLVARSAGEIEDAAAALRDRGHNAVAAPLDVTDPEAVSRFLDGRDAFDILVNSAGMNRPRPFVDVTLDDFDQIVGLNLRASFFVTQAVIRRLKAQKKGGSIINISSQMGHVGAVNRSVYCASKWALEGFTKAVAVEVAKDGIRMNTLCPTFIETPMTRPFLADQAFRADVLSRIKLGRVGQVEDLTGAVVFLASDASALMTGTSLLIDGGWTAD